MVINTDSELAKRLLEFANMYMPKDSRRYAAQEDFYAAHQLLMQGKEQAAYDAYFQILGRILIDMVHKRPEKIITSDFTPEMYMAFSSEYMKGDIDYLIGSRKDALDKYRKLRNEVKGLESILGGQKGDQLLKVYQIIDGAITYISLNGNVNMENMVGRTEGDQELNKAKELIVSHTDDIDGILNHIIDARNLYKKNISEGVEREDLMADASMVTAMMYLYYDKKEDLYSILESLTDYYSKEGDGHSTKILPLYFIQYITARDLKQDNVSELYKTMNAKFQEQYSISSSANKAATMLDLASETLDFFLNEGWNDAAILCFKRAKEIIKEDGFELTDLVKTKMGINDYRMAMIYERMNKDELSLDAYEESVKNFESAKPDEDYDSEYWTLLSSGYKILANRYISLSSQKSKNMKAKYIAFLRRASESGLEKYTQKYIEELIHEAGEGFNRYGIEKCERLALTAFKEAKSLLSRSHQEGNLELLMMATTIIGKMYYERGEKAKFNNIMRSSAMTLVDNCIPERDFHNEWITGFMGVISDDNMFTVDNVYKKLSYDIQHMDKN